VTGFNKRLPTVDDGVDNRVDMRERRCIRPASPDRVKLRNNEKVGISRRCPVRTSHRGYWFKRKGIGYEVEHVLWRLFPALPKQFQWKAEVTIAKHYVDALYAGDIKTTTRYEREGAVTDVQFSSAADIDEKSYQKVNAGRLFDALALVDEFDVPLWDQLAFVTDGNYLVPCDFVGLLAGLDPKRFGHLNPKNEWVRARPSHLVSMGLKPEQVTSGMYRNRKPAAAAPVAAAAAPAADYDDDQADTAAEAPQSPPRERTISRRDRVDYVEWLTEIEYEGQRPYYCRRLYRDQRAMYEATSFNINGPWTVYLRDNNALLALGIDP
jgi:hypothetical protein